MQSIKLPLRLTAPTGRSYHTTIKTGTSLIVYGGMDSQSNCSEDVYELDLTTKMWNIPTLNENAEKQPRPIPRYQHASCLKSENEIVISGGKNRYGELLNDIWIYNISEKTWKCIRPLNNQTFPEGISQHGMVYNEKMDSLYIWGGYQKRLEKEPELVHSKVTINGVDSAPSSPQYLHTPTTPGNQWDRKQNQGFLSPNTLKGPSLKDMVTSPTQTELYNDTMNDKSTTWSTSKDPVSESTVRQSDYKEGTLGLYHTMYVYSFFNNQWIKSNVNERGNAHLIPSARYQHAMFAWRSQYILLFGGRDQLNNYNDIWRFDIETSTWTRILPRSVLKPPAMSTPAAEMVNNRLYVYSGGLLSETTRKLYESLYVFDFERLVWVTIELKGDIPTPRVGHTLSLATTLRDSKMQHTELYADLYPRLVIFGGSTGSTELSDMFELMDAQIVIEKQHERLKELFDREEQMQNVVNEHQHKLKDSEWKLSVLFAEKNNMLQQQVHYKNHIDALETQNVKLKEQLKQQDRTIHLLNESQTVERQSLEKKDKETQDLSINLATLKGQKAVIAQQLTDTRTQLEQIEEQLSTQELVSNERESHHINLIETHTKRIGEMQDLIELLNHQLDQKNAMIREIQQALEDAKETAKQTQASIEANLQSTIDAQREEMVRLHKKMETEREHANAKLKSIGKNYDFHLYVVSEQWRLYDDEISYASNDTQGVFDGHIVDIKSVNLGERRKSRRNELFAIREVYRLAGLKDYSHVCQTYGVIIKDDAPRRALIVREKTIMNLHEFLTTHKPTLQERVFLCYEMALGLKAIHDGNIHHGTLSPYTIRLTEGQNIKIVKHIRLQVPECFVVSSTDFPLAERRSIDMFALGLVMYYCITNGSIPQWSSKPFVKPSLKDQVFLTLPSSFAEMMSICFRSLDQVEIDSLNYSKSKDLLPFNDSQDINVEHVHPNLDLFINMIKITMERMK